MTLRQSPGQRRRSRIVIGLLLLICASAILGWYISGPKQQAAKAALADPNKIVIQALIVDLREERETYRNFKGRQRTRYDYYVDLSYTHRDESIEETRDVARSEFDRYRVGNTIELLAVGPEQNTIYTRHELTANSVSARSSGGFKGAIVGAILAFILSRILLPLFGREPDGHMPKGFYTENSWLDIQDTQLIAIVDDKLLQFKFKKDHTKNVQQAYQSGDNMKHMLSVAEENEELVVVPLADVVAMDAWRSESHIGIAWRVEGPEEQSTQAATLEFLNPTMRNHALRMITQKLGDKFLETVTHETRLASAFNSILLFLLALIAIWFFEHPAILVLAAFLLLHSLFKIIARLWKPRVYTEVALKTN